uniref:Uncharacterized protein n=1 Tax=Arundo donax TaxID=35708 RepID=A0A0A8XRL2_ARUDO
MLAWQLYLTHLHVPGHLGAFLRLEPASASSK